MSDKKSPPTGRSLTRDRKLPERMRKKQKSAKASSSSNGTSRPTRRSDSTTHCEGAHSLARSIPEGSYEVGYGKPPKHTRFKKGQSGNKRGRPRGAVNLKTLLERGLNEHVPVSRGGKTQRMRLIEAILAQLTRKSAGGDLAAMRYLIETAIKLNAFSEPEQVGTPGQKLTPEEQAHIDQLMSWLNGTPNTI